MMKSILVRQSRVTFDWLFTGYVSALQYLCTTEARHIRGAENKLTRDQCGSLTSSATHSGSRSRRWTS